MNVLILFSHGSVLCGAGEALEAHATRLRERGDWDRVEIGYLNYSDPPFMQTVERVVTDGATRVTVAPYLLVPGFFVNKCREMLEEARAAHSGVMFTMGGALGTDERLADALLEAALSPQPRERWRDGLARAAAHCRPDPQCPLYGTPACPKVPVAPEPESPEPGKVAAGV